MRIPNEYVLRTVAGEHMVVPVGRAALRIQGLLRLSESGKLLFEKLQQEDCTRESLRRTLQDAYEIENEAEAAQDVDRFLARLETLGMLEDLPTGTDGPKDDRERTDAL